MAKKKSVSVETNALQDLLGVGAGLLNVGGSLLNGTSKVIQQIANRTVEVSMVTECLDELQIKASQYTTEKNIESIVAQHIDSDYDVHRQYNIGGFLGLKIDIDVNQSVGIEIKLAKELVGSASAIERLLGQLIYYRHRKYGKKLVVLVVGTKKEKSRVLEELEDLIDSLNITFYYLEVSSRGW